MTFRVLVAVLLAIPLAAPPADAQQVIAGIQLTVQNPGDPSRRKVTTAGRRNDFLQVYGNVDEPGGSATLTVRLDGANSATHAFVLPQGEDSTGRPFWRFVAAGAGGGYLYRDPRGEQGPVSMVMVKALESHSGVARSAFKLTMSGKHAPLPLVPPNPGTQAWVTLDIDGGPLYCIQYADGDVVNEGTRRFSLRRPQSFGCPPP